jgi:hypothetical protein
VGGITSGIETVKTVYHEIVDPTPHKEEIVKPVKRRSGVENPELSRYQVSSKRKKTSRTVIE